MLIEKIREVTKPMHEKLDAALVPFITNIQSTDDYIKLLVAFYGFFKPVYSRIDTHLQTSFLPDYHTRRKPVDILKNLEALHYHQPVKNICVQLPLIVNNATAFGALYVMEGSTLGGLMIKKMIAGQTRLSDEQLSFFTGYGKKTREHWNVFVASLNEAANNESEEQAVITSAAETFTCFKDWLHTVYF